jgi:hypothetical protein
MPMPIALIFALVLAAAPASAVAPAPEATATPSPQRVLAIIRSVFRSHRPPPPFITYTLIRAQKDDHGFPDFVNSYTYHIWSRSLDRAALARRVFRDTYRGDLEFQRPSFNEPWDPGPPTADLFEPAPARPHTVDNFVPTPEPAQTPLRVIGEIGISGEFDYTVKTLVEEGDVVHLSVIPVRDPDRNRLREIYADRKTYELRKLVATDKLFIDRGPVYGVTFTITIGTLEGHPIVTDIHGVVGDNYSGDGQEVDYKFRDIKFPAALPDWYFDKRAYGQHKSEAPL